MSLVINSYPLVSGVGSFVNAAFTISMHVAAHNPVVVRAIRKDLNITSIADDGTGLTRLNVAEDLGTFGGDPIGQKVYVFGSAGINGVQLVINSNAGAGTSYIDINLSYSAIHTAFYVNLIELRPGYYIDCQVEDYDGTNYNTVGSARFHPDKDGVCDMNVSRFLRGQLSFQDDWVYQNTNALDRNLSCQVRFTLTETWLTSSETPASPIILYGVNAAMQARNRVWYTDTGGFYSRGSNMADYVLEPTGADKAKFLSVSRKLRYWEGLPFTLEFIYSSLLVSSPSFIRQVETAYNLSGNVVQTLNTDLLANQKIGVNRISLKPNFPASIVNYIPTVSEVDVHIANGDDNERLTEQIRVRLVREEDVPCTPIFLKALDYTGGWRYFCFGPKHTDNLQVTNGATFTQFFQDISDQWATSEVLSKSAVPSLVIGAENIDEWDVQVIKAIVSSPRIEMLANPDEWNVLSVATYPMPIWKGVKVKSGSVRFGDSSRKVNKVEFTLELNETFLQTA